MRAERSAEIVALLSAIEREFVRFDRGAEAASVIAELNEKIGELRDVLWHEMPRELARRMDAEDGLSANRGKWP
jgi:hypothetical protein